jgi:hypothetical protein
MQDKPTVKLTGEDGNVLNVIGKVRQAIQDQQTPGWKNRRTEFTNRAFNAKSYDEVLRIAMEYANVE